MEPPRTHAPPRRWERMALSYSRTPFAYLLLFGALYAGFGVLSPYLPRLMQEHGLRAETIGVAYGSFSLPARFTPGPRVTVPVHS